jgi:hypothetical protein
MSNVGLEIALGKANIPLVRTAVGDRNVLEEMERRGANLGGEQSGHVIFLDHEPTGDGMLTGLKVLEVVKGLGPSSARPGRGARGLSARCCINVRVRERRGHRGHPEIKSPSRPRALRPGLAAAASSVRLLGDGAAACASWPRPGRGGGAARWRKRSSDAVKARLGACRWRPRAGSAVPDSGTQGVRSGRRPGRNRKLSLQKALPLKGTVARGRAWPDVCYRGGGSSAP